MIKAIIFDLDNTLIDFVKMKKRSCEAAIDAMIDNGLKTSRKKAFKIMFKIYDKHGWEYQKIFQQVVEQIMGKIDYKIIAAGIVAYRKVKQGLIYSYPGTKSVLNELKRQGYRLVIVSDAPRIQAWIRLVSMNLQDTFDHVITFNDSKKKKPDKRPFLLALKKLKIKPEQVIMIGDSVKKDLITSKKMGMTTVLAKYGQTEKEKGKPDYEIRNIKQILNVVKKANK